MAPCSLFFPVAEGFAPHTKSVSSFFFYFAFSTFFPDRSIERERKGSLLLLLLLHSKKLFPLDTTTKYRSPSSGFVVAAAWAFLLRMRFQICPSFQDKEIEKEKEKETTFCFLCERKLSHFFNLFLRPRSPCFSLSLSRARLSQCLSAPSASRCTRISSSPRSAA